MLKKSFIPLAAGAMALAFSCAKVQDVPADRDAAMNASIGFSTSALRSTKASVHNIDSAKTNTYEMTSYLVDGATGDAVLYFAPEDFGYGINPEFPTAWNTATTHFWPSSTMGTRPSATLSFFTWGPKKCGISFELNGYRMEEDRSLPRLSVNVADSYADQVDMLAAMSEYEVYAVGGATIAYNHILSAVSFSAAAESDTLKYVVKDIRVGVSRIDTSARRLYPSGVYGYARANARGGWDGWSGDLKHYHFPVASSDTVKHAASSLTSRNGLLMLVPQELEEAGAYFSIMYDIYSKDNVLQASNIVKYGGLFTTSLKEWKTGVKYNYIVTIPEEVYRPITYTVSVVDWVDQDVIVAESENIYSEEDPEAVSQSGDDFGRLDW